MEYSLGYFLGHIVNATRHYIDSMPAGDITWLCIGLVGQGLFMMRFIVQWIHSERHKQSLIPVSFWYFSLIGGLTVLAYGFHKAEPVIILGQLPGTIVYARNLMLIKRNRT
ncbi:MAG: lipid-A-disaccharide synthase N-terminal domain-containing protein [Methylophilus sp.]